MAHYSNHSTAAVRMLIGLHIVPNPLRREEYREKIRAGYDAASAYNSFMMA